MTQPEARQKSRPQFSAYILLSEAIQFNTAEIRSALREDYPGLDLSDEQSLRVPDRQCDTADFITTPILMGGARADDAIATAIRLPGYGTWSMDQLSHRQHRMVPDMQAVLQRNAFYVCISVGAKSDSMTDTFRAARLCSCLAAVFARLPVALAAYWESASHFLPPRRVVEMADSAMADDWPLASWIGYSVDETRAAGSVLRNCSTHGLLPFKGYEFGVLSAPLSPEEVCTLAGTATAMVLEYGHSFKDGDTLGLEGQSPEQSVRIRHLQAGSRYGVDFDLMLLVHPCSPVDHEALAGPLRSQPAPPDFRRSGTADRGSSNASFAGSGRPE